MNAFKGQISNCGVQFIEHNNRMICFLVSHDVTTKHNTQINSKFKVIKIDVLEIIIMDNNKK